MLFSMRIPSAAATVSRARILFNKEADINAQGGYYGNALQMKAEAEALYECALSGKESVLGSDNPSALGNLYVDNDGLTKAKMMYKQMMAGNEKALEPSCSCSASNSDSSIHFCFKYPLLA